MDLNLTVEFFERFTTDELCAIITMAESVKAKRKDNLPAEIKQSKISVRTKNALLANDFKYWHEVSKSTQCNLKKLRWIGGGTLSEIIRELHLRGLELKYK